MVEVSAGEVSTLVAGEVYCLMIEACQPIVDYDRLARVDRAAQRLVRRPAGAGDVHRPVRGAPRADHADPRGVRGAAGRVRPGGAALPGRPHAGRRRTAHGERADVLRLRGDLSAAEAAYAAASASRLRTAAGPGTALAGAGPDRGRRRRREPAARRARAGVHRARLLPAAVEILLAAGLIDQAAGVADGTGSVCRSDRHAGGPGHGQVRRRPACWSPAAEGQPGPRPAPRGADADSPSCRPRTRWRAAGP